MTALWIVVAVVVTLLATLLALNLTSRQLSVERRVDHLYDIADPQFARAMGSLLGPALVGGNRVTVLRNGDRIFPAMLAAIREARRTVSFETYIYWSGEVGREFADALAERARAGVRAHVVLDWLGAGKMDESLIARMQDAGVRVVKYHPLRWYHLNRLNNRTHRKLLVVDGRVGFTGGVGIADVWRGDAQDPEHWRDTHFRVEGPVVAQMQAAFMDNWIGHLSQQLVGQERVRRMESPGSGVAEQALELALLEHAEAAGQIHGRVHDLPCARHRVVFGRHDLDRPRHAVVDAVGPVLRDFFELRPDGFEPERHFRHAVLHFRVIRHRSRQAD
jgi:cardiolipin synthase